MDEEITGFLEYMKNVKKASKNTILSYRQDLEYMKNYYKNKGIYSVGKINNTNLNSFIMFMESENRSQATIARSVSCIKSFFSYMLRRGLICGDPTEYINLPVISRENKNIKQKNNYTRKEKIKNILKNISENTGSSIKTMNTDSIDYILKLRNRAMLEVVRATEIRPSQLTELKVEDINFNLSYIVCRSLKGDRIIKLDKEAVEAVSEYTTKARDKLVYKDNKENPCEYLFCNRSGKKLSRQGYWKILKSNEEHT